MIPVILVTGFLGAGKSTLVARLLDNDEDAGLAVIVHDLGEENIDVAYLQGGEHVELRPAGRILSIASGPLTGEHEMELIRNLDRLCEGDRPPSAVLVEASGSADTVSLQKRLRQNRDGWSLASVIAVLDAPMLGHYLQDRVIAPLLERQASAASLLVLNKWDRASRKEKMAARQYTRSLNSRSGRAIVRASFGRVAAKDVFRPRSIPPGPPESVSPAGAGIESIHLKERRPFHPKRLEQWLNGDWPGIIRVKGFLWLASDMDGIYVLDAAGPQRELGLEGTWYAAVAESELAFDGEIRALVTGHPWGDRRQALTVIGSPSGLADASRELRRALLSDAEMAEGPALWCDYTDPLTPLFPDR